MESVEAFGRRARDWIESNLPRVGEAEAATSRERVRQAQSLQQQIFDAGFGAITWPAEYGGHELSPAHMHAFVDALHGFVNPYRTLSVSLGVVAPTILEFGTAEQKVTWLPPLLRGDTLWVQLLSEPSGGSDMAGVLTRATRDGDTWVLDGSKVWTTFGHHADYGLCLARSDWDVPKHRGLSMFVVPLDAPGVTVLPLTQASGATEFCQEFLEDVSVPADHLLGPENDGWTVASQLLVQERTALGGGSVHFAGGHADDGDDDGDNELVARAIAAGLWDDASIRQRVAAHHADAVVSAQLATRVATGMRTGAFAGPAGSMLKLSTANLHLDRAELLVELSGPDIAAWRPDDRDAEGTAMGWLTRQGTSIMGGTNEIQRNIISERVLGMPREAAPDKDVPFTQVRTNRRGSDR
jgi:alkylation response protein AidB-like acyl-CoA dehydrogenase